jgi:transcriptional regulator with XRE-family HTH domain
MSYGYSAKVVALNQQADKSNLGVRLGRACIKKDIPVSMVATMLGVSRQTLYNWFIGKSSPQPMMVDLVARYLERISK